MPEQPTAPSRMETLGTLRISNVDMAFATAFITLTTGVFLVGFVQSLGGKAFWVNMLAALPSLCGILQIPGAIWGRSFPTYKKVVSIGGSVWRILYIPLIFLPLLVLPDTIRLYVLVACVALGSAAVATVNPVYNDWLAELVPSNSRGFFFGRRNAIGVAVGAAVGIVGALVLDALKSAGKQNLGFSVIFALAIVCSGISLWAFFQMRDIPRAHPVKQNIAEGLKAIAVPFRDKEYKRVLLFLAVAVAGQAFAGNLFAAFALDTLKLDYKVIQGTAVCHAAGQILAIRFWGYVADKYGNKPVLTLMSFLMALCPIPWILCVPGADMRNSLILLSTHVLMGVIWSGVNLCQFNIMLATAKPEDRGNYIAAGMTVSSIMGGIAPLLGAALFMEFNVSMAEATSYKLVFAATIVLRIIAAFCLKPVKEEGAKGLAQTMRVLGTTMTPRGLLAMRGLAKGTDVASREAAIQSAGESRIGLASDEVIKALHDPQPRVRRQAASALARLNDPRAVGELIHQLDEHPELVEEETVAALGTLRDPQAVPQLVSTLHSPRSILRRAAARALGEIGGQDAIPALMGAVSDPSDPDLRRSALQALRLMGATEAESAIVGAITDSHPSVRIAAAEAVSELGLHSAAPVLRDSLVRHRGEAMAEIAYALGAVGDRSDIAQILDEAAASVSIITRSRCLLGVARLLGVEPAAYKLMLLDGMARDTALMEVTRSFAKKNHRLTTALNRFSSGDEEGALAELASAFTMPELAVLCAKPVPELFLVAALFVVSQ